MSNVPMDYLDLLKNVKDKIRAAQYKAVLSVNKEMILLYWGIGADIIKNATWGNKFIENLSKDIQYDFPGIKGYSVRNLKYMQKFANEFPDYEIVQLVVAQLSWRHIIKLMDKVKGYEVRLWYARKAIQNGWSNSVLSLQIESDLFSRQALSDKTTNYGDRLPSPQSDLAIETLKDPYVFDFITMSEELKEREVERQLTRNIAKLLLELGTGFAFMGNQYHLEVAGQDFYVDMLFYNVKLRCYVVVELKIGAFRPEYAGKVNFYLSVIDDQLKSSEDNPSIGIILCKDKNKLVAEYTLKDMTKPIGVAEFKLLESVTKEIEEKLYRLESDDE